MGRRVAQLGAALLLTIAAGPVSANDTVLLRADAGLAGLCKPGRWTPVRVSIENNGSDLAGEVVVEWGDATVRRRVELAAPSRDVFELYARTPDTRAAITVRLRANDMDVRTVTVPVRLEAAETPTTICVSDANDQSESVGCDATIAPRALPRSMRGYDAADRLVWRAGPESVLDTEQKIALDRWRNYRELDDAGLLALAPRVAPPAPSGGVRRALGPVTAAAAIYLLLLIGLVRVARTARRRPVPIYAAIALLATIGSATALAAGRIGPASAVLVRSTTTLLQLASGGVVVSTRGVIEYPQFDTFQIRADATDAALGTPGSTTGELAFDERGYPELSGQFGLGTSREFTLDGVLDATLLNVEQRANDVTVTNVSPYELRDCRFPTGFSVREIGTVKPGQSVEATGAASIESPYFTCALAQPPLDFVDRRHAVQMSSSSMVAAILPFTADAGDGRR